MDKPKRTILQVLEMDPNKRGVLELQLLEMASQLRKIGWKQLCIFKNAPKEWLIDWSERTGGIMLGISNPSGSGIGKVIEIAQENSADIVHTHFIAVQSKLFPILKSAGFNLIVNTQHTYRQQRRFELLRRVYRCFHARHICKFIAVSNYIKHQARRDYLLKNSRIKVILNGVNLEYFRPREDKYELRKNLFNLDKDQLIITSAAHLHPLKRLDMLVKAMAILSSKVPNAYLIIAGGGQERENLLSLIKKLSLQNRAQVLSGDNRVELIYAASDVGVLPSEGEGLPGGAIEAMACGLPFVATPCGGLAEVPEDGRSGVLVKNQTTEGLADAIISLLLNPELRKNMGFAARKRAEEAFDVRRTAEKTIGLYKELMGK